MCLAAVPTWAAEERISGLLRSMTVGGPLPAENAFHEAVDEDYVNQLSPDSVKEFLPLARALLQDPRPEARKYGLTCFLVVTLRRALDSEPLLEPYIPDLLRIADDRASPLRLMALFVLGNTYPKVSSRTLEYLAAHLADKDNTTDDASAMLGTLLRAGSDPLTHDVIAFARKQNKHEVSEAVLKCLRLYRTKNADALAFIGDSLDSRDAWTRRMAVEAVATMPLVERSPFLAQLSRLSADPNEPTEIRSMAAEALKK